jgi:hypothetical protein
MAHNHLCHYQSEVIMDGDGIEHRRHLAVSSCLLCFVKHRAFEMFAEIWYWCFLVHAASSRAELIASEAGH